jgi:hypothetical protein
MESQRKIESILVVLLEGCNLADEQPKAAEAIYDDIMSRLTADRTSKEMRAIVDSIREVCNADINGDN